MNDRARHAGAAALQIRPLVAGDQGRLWRWLHLALWDPPPAPLRPLAVLDEPRVRIYAEGWGRAGDVGVVGEVDGVPIGACWLRRLPAGVGLASIDATTPQLGIALEPAFQHRGIGLRLMRAALASARDCGYARVALTVHPQNPAIRLYVRCGFQDIDTRNGYRLMVAMLATSRHVFSDYSNDWPRDFAAEAAALEAQLGDVVVAIHHIGSTSVPGLAAKATIDMLPLVRSLEALDAKSDRLADAGYSAWGEFGLRGRRYFTKDRNGARTHNVHCYRFDDPEVERHLAFCAYLREHPAACAEYAALKRDVFARHADDMLAYNDGKDAWIKALEPTAIAWYRAIQGWRGDGGNK